MDWITHDALKRSIRNTCTHLSWETRCAEMARLGNGAPVPDSENATPLAANSQSPANDAANAQWALASRERVDEEGAREDESESGSASCGMLPGPTRARGSATGSRNR
jgi:hypothetical protein